MKPVSIFNVERKRLCFLENAHNISYTKALNALWTAEFSLPYSDQKKEYCQPFNLVELWDVDSVKRDIYIGLFRILPIAEEAVARDGIITYQLEHVLSTLLDDIMIGWVELGGSGITTTKVLSAILEAQAVKNWTLEACDYEYLFAYGWQDENLLSALYSVVKPFVDNDYYWAFRTDTYPWRLRLAKAATKPVMDIRYRKNLTGFKRIIDPTNVTTRLYCYGGGDGENRIGIRKVNEGIPYLDSTNKRKYGIISQVWTDPQYMTPLGLKQAGLALLKKIEEPVISYVAEVQTVNELAAVDVGERVRVVHDTFDETMIVRKISKSNVSQSPFSGSITLGAGTVRDFGESLATMLERQRISDTYAQGAESIFTDSFTDNADPAFPAIITFRIPENSVHVNEVRLSITLAKFRAYSKAADDGGSTTKTTEGGGGISKSSENNELSDETSEDGGKVLKASSEDGNKEYTSKSTEEVSFSAEGGGGINETTEYKDRDTGDAIWNKDERRHEPPGSPVRGGSSAINGHQHPLLYHSHNDDHKHKITVEPHIHPIKMKGHWHKLDTDKHTHTLDLVAHKHQIKLKQHTHPIKLDPHVHELKLAPHGHALIYGIYEGPKASRIKVSLDNTFIFETNGDVNGIDLVQFMPKDSMGNVVRGAHKIKIEPNSLTRIEVSFQIRLFTNSRGGNQY